LKRSEIAEVLLVWFLFEVQVAATGKVCAELARETMVKHFYSILELLFHGLLVFLLLVVRFEVLSGKGAT
jgi:hypothetical protein